MVEQLDLWSLPAEKPVLSPANANDSDAFGCCSRYRACSEQGKCLISDLDYSVHCAYRANLESGRIFYGKNAVGFSAQQYDTLVSAVSALDDNTRALLDRLIIEFCEYRRGVESVVIRREWSSELSEVPLFEFSRLGSAFPRLCGYFNLLDAVKGSTDFGVMFQRAQKNAEGKKLKPQSKAFLTSWLNSEGVELREKLVAPYLMVSIRPGMRPYVEELYHDTLLSSIDSRVYGLSPIAEDGWLSATDYEKEELRRISLSRGYSQEEKAALTASVLDGRAARSAKANDGGAL